MKSRGIKLVPLSRLWVPKENTLMRPREKLSMSEPRARAENVESKT